MFDQYDLVATTVELPGGPLVLQQPAQWADLPDDGGFEWAPIAPYWAVLWRSGQALARLLARGDLAGTRVIELGCGLGVPSLAAARAGAEVLATDSDPEALELLARNAAALGLDVATAQFDFRDSASMPPGAPFDLALAADVLYEEESVGPLLELLPRLTPRAIVCSPERTPFERFTAEARLLWDVKTTTDGVVELLELELG